MTKKGLTEQFRFLPSLLGPDKIIVLFVRHLSLLFNKATSPYSLMTTKNACTNILAGKGGTCSETRLQMFNPLEAYAEHVCLWGGKHVRTRFTRVLLRVVPQYNIGFPKSSSWKILASFEYTLDPIFGYNHYGANI